MVLYTFLRVSITKIADSEPKSDYRCQSDIAFEGSYEILHPEIRSFTALIASALEKDLAEDGKK